MRSRRSAGSADVAAAVASVRVNPGLGGGYNDRLHYAGAKPTKFGIYPDRFGEAMALAMESGLEVDTLHFHIGSGYLGDALEVLDQVLVRVGAMLDAFPQIRTLNVGGGLGLRLTETDRAMDIARWQRLSYFSSFLAYFESFQKLILILMPVFIIMCNVFPMHVNVLEFLLRWTPYFVLSVLANKIGGRGYFRYLQTEKYNILKMAVFIQSTLTLFHRKSLRFKVTPKSVDDSVYKEERRTLRVYMVILGAMTGAIVYGLFKTIFVPVTTLEIEAYLIAIFWAGYNAMLIFIGIYEVLGKSHERKQYRFPVQLTAEIHRDGYAMEIMKVELNNLSITGASFTLDGKFLAEDHKLLLHIRTAGQKLIVLPVNKVHRQVRDTAGRIHAGVSFADKKDIYRERLFEYLFVEVPAMQAMPRGQRDNPQDLSVIQALLSQRPAGKGPEQLLEDTMP